MPNTQFPAMDSAHCISSIYSFISSAITPFLIQRVQAESSKFVQYRNYHYHYHQEDSPTNFLLLDISSLDFASRPVGRDTPYYRIFITRAQLR